MKRTLANALSDAFWPTLDGDARIRQKCETEKFGRETETIGSAVSVLDASDDVLEKYLGASEKLLDAENARRLSIESRLLNALGLVSVAGTVVLGVLITLAIDKPALNLWTRGILALGCLYLALELFAVLNAAVKGLRAAEYVDDQPHELLPRAGASRTDYLRDRIRCLLIRGADHRRVNNSKFDHLGIAYCAMRNFLVGLLIVAVVTTALTILWPQLPLVTPSAVNGTVVPINR